MNDNQAGSAQNAQDLADLGMTRALDHANDKAPGWSDRAFGFVYAFALQTHEFLGEDVRIWAHNQMGLDLPPKACAWGAVMMRASRESIIENAGYAKTRIPPQHSKPAVRWRSLVVREAA